MSTWYTAREDVRTGMCSHACQGDPGLQARLAPSSPKPLLMSSAICCSAALPILTKSSSTLLQMPIRHFYPELRRPCVIWLPSPDLQLALPDASAPLLQQAAWVSFVGARVHILHLNGIPSTDPSLHGLSNAYLHN